MKPIRKNLEKSLLTYIQIGVGGVRKSFLARQAPAAAWQRILIQLLTLHLENYVAVVYDVGAANGAGIDTAQTVFVHLFVSLARESEQRYRSNNCNSGPHERNYPPGLQ